MTTHTLESLIDAAFERRADITPANVPADLRAGARSEIVGGLNAGRLRVAEKIDGAWVTHQWIKKAVLLSFRAHDNRVIDGGRDAPTSTRCRCASPATPTREFRAGRLARGAAGRGAPRRVHRTQRRADAVAT